MSESFSVGEIAVLAKAIYFKDREGLECEIIGGLWPRKTWATPFGPGLCDPYINSYFVRYRDGVESNVEPWQLRKRRPPQDWVKLCRLTDLPREVTHV